MQGADTLSQVLLFGILQKAAADLERPAGDRNLDVFLVADLSRTLAEQADHVGGIERRGNRRNGTRFRNPMRGGEHRGAAETVADQHGRCGQRLAEMVGGGDQIVDVRGKVGVGELAFAGAEPGEIEAQHGDTVELEAFGDVARRPDALAAGKAMRKQRHRPHRSVRPVEQRGELLAMGVGEIELFGGHGWLLRSGHHKPVLRPRRRA